MVDRARRIHPALSPRQADILSELVAAGTEGTTPGAIARALNHDQANMDIMLSGLANQGLVDRDASVYPHNYRLSAALLGGGAGGGRPDA